MLPNFIIIDFDSTFISKESLDELASHALQRSKSKDLILDQIHQLTDDGMSGKITFYESSKTTRKRKVRFPIEKISFAGFSWFWVDFRPLRAKIAASKRFYLITKTTCNY